MQAKLVSSSFAAALCLLLLALGIGGLELRPAALPLLVGAVWLLDFGYYSLLLDRRTRRDEQLQWRRVRGMFLQGAAVGRGELALTLPLLLRWRWRRPLLAVTVAASLDLTLAVCALWLAG